MMQTQGITAQVNIGDIDHFIDQDVQRGAQKRPEPGWQFFFMLVGGSFIFQCFQGLVRKGKGTEKR